MRTIILLFTISYFSARGQSPEVLIQSGVDLIEANPDSAIVKFNRAIKLNPASYEPWYYISYCYSSIGNYSETIRYAKEALKRKTNDPNSLALLGLAQILSVDKLTGCENLNKSLLLNDSDENIQQLFRQLCGKYYKITINSELNDSTLIDKIVNYFNDNWSLNSIGQEDGYIQFALVNNNYLNYKESRSFELEWNIYVFDKKLNDNLLKVKQDYKSITSKVDFKSYNIGDKEIIIAIIDTYLRAEEVSDYSKQRKKLLKEIKKFGTTL